jgi:cell division protein FtsW (lipid II flippase)
MDFLKRSKTRFVTYDNIIMMAYLALCVIGLYIMLDINSVRTSLHYFYRQFIFSIFSIGVTFFVMYKVKLDFLRKTSFIWVIMTIGLLIWVLVAPNEVKGATRSIRLGPVSFQPSLLARIILVFYVAHILDKKKDFIENSRFVGFFKNFAPIYIIGGAFYSLILIEKHFSPLVISSLTVFCMLWIARIKFSTLLIFILIASSLGIGIVSFGPKYRSERIKIFKRYNLFNKKLKEQVKDESLKDYQIRESLTALSVGKLTGTGPDRGRAKQYYLPEAKTDYIYAIIGEEFGFLGSLFVFGIYCLLFFRTVWISYHTDDLFLQLAGLGLGLNIFLNVIVNIGVAMSALPSTGVTLPFISYGGTSLAINSLGIGLLLNISAQRRA